MSQYCASLGIDLNIFVLARRGMRSFTEATSIAQIFVERPGVREEHMARNIVICCDGTSNQPARDMTNVAKLYFSLENDVARQISFYHPGLGTMEAPGALTGAQKVTTVLMGLAFGRGIEDDIRDAYVFLSDFYEPGDRVFLFGFSRGAYTVRALTGLIRMYGLLQPGNAPLAPYAIRMMFAINRARGCNDKETADEVFKLAYRFRDAYGRECKPHFVGLWDTVSSVGWFSHPTHLPYTANNPDIEIGRHAVAIDERRAFFPCNLWRPEAGGKSGPRDLKQVWFPGSHCDVGGGYPEGPQSAQSKYPLDWMMNEASTKGLLLDSLRRDDVLGKAPGSSYQVASVDYPLAESLTGLWTPAEFLPKPHYDYETDRTAWKMHLFARRVIPPGSRVHQSAYARGEKYMRRIPPDAVVEP